MINPAELVRRPFRERDLLPIATDAQVIERFQERIEDIRREVKSPIRAPHFRHSNPLLHISGEEEYSLIGGERYSSLGQLKVERGHGQELLFKAISAYGFNPEISHPFLRYNYTHKQYREDVTARPDGTTREVLVFPSQTIKGLSFERMRYFVTNTGETSDVWWNVVDGDHYADTFSGKIDIGSIFRRNPKPQISL